MRDVASVLVLGASGRLGAMLRRYWPDDVQAMWQFRRAVDHRDAVIFDPLGRDAALARCDVVVGLAGCVGGSDAALRSNTDLALAAVDLGAKLGARRVFLSSSAAVYGHQTSPLVEDGPTRPQSPYGAEKLRMEGAALAHAQACGVAVTVLRIGNVAGADALLGQAGLGQAGLGKAGLGQAGLGQAGTEQAGLGAVML
ncbi:MAG: NAD-dependent epimerase/dehydratase family protein, partial [Rhodobacterales bacterium]